MNPVNRAALLAGIALSSVVSFPAMAQFAQQDTVKAYTISGQSLDTALKTFARQAGIQILYSSNDVAGKFVSPLNGRYAVGTALDQLLSNSGLRAVLTAPNTIVIERENGIRKVAHVEYSDEPEAPPAPIASGPSAPQAPQEEIVVTGSLIRQSTIPSPINVLDAKSLAARAITNASELVRAVPANSGSEAQVDQLNQPLTSGTAQFNLRNLGLGSTLVLINGRRQTLSAVAATDGSTFTDINSMIPLIALQRIEIVKDGAAATYGSDAVAGVVNFITRKSVDRPIVTARTNFMDGAQQLDVAALAGAKIAGGDLVVAASYYQSTRLGTDERSFSRARTFGRPSWHSVSSFGQPGSYFVPSLNRFVPDPDCTNAAFPDSYKNSPSDTFCRFDFSDYFDLIPKERRAQIYASYNAALTDSVSINLEAAYANTYSKTTSSPSFPILAVTPVVPASHPDNPFGEDVRFRGRLLNGAYGPSIATFNYDTFRVAGGLEGKLGESWTWSMDASYSQQLARYNKPDTMATALRNALNGLGGAGCNPATGTPGVGPCVYYNPFGSAALGTGTTNSPALISSLIGYSDLRGKASLITLDGLLTGNLFDYSLGTVAAAIGVQYRRNSFRHDWSDLVNAGELITLGQAPDFSGVQETVSVFGELKIPLGERVEAQVSGRYESYKGSFSNLSPKFALLVRPIDALSLRASYGKAFRAPSVYQQVAVQSAQPSVNDGGTFVFVNTQTSGDPSLRPEESTNYNLGATLKPLRGLEFNVDYYSFKYNNLIVKENPQPIIDQAHADDLAGLSGTAAQQRVVRDINGTLQLVRLRFVNASSVSVRGLDIGGRYSFDTDFGAFEANVAWSHAIRYDLRLSAGGPVIHGVGSVNFNNFGRSLPKDRIEYGLNWTYGRHQLNLLGHYVSGYQNDRSGVTSRDIKSQQTFDVQYTLTLEDLLGSGKTQLTAGAINIFDKAPPLAQLNLGFDPIVHDPRGRVLTLAVRQEF